MNEKLLIFGLFTIGVLVAWGVFLNHREQVVLPVTPLVVDQQPVPSAPQQPPLPPAPVVEAQKQPEPTDEQKKLGQSPEAKAFADRVQNGQPLTQGDLQVALKMADLAGKRIPTPKLYQYKEYPPTTAEGKAMWDWYNKMNQADPDWKFKRPISFYGVVEDENGNPIPNANVGLTTRGVDGDLSKEINTRSDGQFALDNQQGKYLTVGVSAYGYKPMMLTFNYADFFDDSFIVPDPNNPVVFQLGLTP